MGDEDDIHDVAVGGGHSLFAPSSAHRWAVCHASVAASAGLPDETTIYAAEGTVAHRLVEHLRTGSEPVVVGQVVRIAGFDVEVTAEMLEMVEAYIDFADREKGHRLVEQRVDFSPYMPVPNQGGTVDDLCMRPFHLVITDLKYGMIKVHAEENWQLLCYALGAFLEWDAIYGFETITIRIGQPRLGHYDEWTTDRLHLLEFGELIRTQAAACLEPDPVFVPSTSTCRFCRAKVTCPARLALLDRLGDEGFDDLVTAPQARAAVALLDHRAALPTLPSVETLTTGHLARVVGHRRGVEVWLKQAYEELRLRALKGEAVPGFKLAEGRAKRPWREGADVVSILTSLGVPKTEIVSLIISSPAAVDAAVAKLPKDRRAKVRAVIKALIDRVPGRPSLVPIKDDQEDYLSPGEQFANGAYDE
jgi:Protein of unknown function (DUF2800)